MPLLKQLSNVRPQMHLFLWQYAASSDGNAERLSAAVDYGKELAKHPSALNGQLAVMAWIRWYFGATNVNRVVVERDRYGIWFQLSEGNKHSGEAQWYKASWSHHRDVAAIMLWSGKAKAKNHTPNFGCDLEPLDRLLLPETLTRIINDEEMALLRLYSGQLDARTRLWTAKEAIFKAGQSNLGLRKGSTIELLPTETDPGSAIVHQYRRTSDGYKVNLHWLKVNAYGVTFAILHTMPMGESRYKDVPLFAKPVK
jgi:hypothetical protein